MKQFASKPLTTAETWGRNVAAGTAGLGLAGGVVNHLNNKVDDKINQTVGEGLQAANQYVDAKVPQLFDYAQRQAPDIVHAGAQGALSWADPMLMRLGFSPEHLAQMPIHQKLAPLGGRAVEAFGASTVNVPLAGAGVLAGMYGATAHGGGGAPVPAGPRYTGRATTSSATSHRRPASGWAGSHSPRFSKGPDAGGL